MGKACLTPLERGVWGQDRKCWALLPGIVSEALRVGASVTRVRGRELAAGARGGPAESARVRSWSVGWAPSAWLSGAPTASVSRAPGGHRTRLGGAA